MQPWVRTPPLLPPPLYHTQTVVGEAVNSSIITAYHVLPLHRLSTSLFLSQAAAVSSPGRWGGLDSADMGIQDPVGSRQVVFPSLTPPSCAALGREYMTVTVSSPLVPHLHALACTTGHRTAQHPEPQHTIGSQHIRTKRRVPRPPAAWLQGACGAPMPGFPEAAIRGPVRPSLDWEDQPKSPPLIADPSALARPQV